MSDQRYPENVVICIDTSRSMYRSDYSPSRLACSVDALKKLVSERLSLDPASSFAIIRFSTNPEKLLNFTSVESEILNTLDSLKIEGESAMGDALAVSIKMIIEELRKVSAKLPRILLISDGNFTTTAVDPIKMSRLANELNIKIDTFRLGEASHLNILKRLSDVSNGRYYYINDIETLKQSALDFARSNLKSSNTKTKTLIENPKFLRKIAANLLRVQDLTKDDEQRIKHIRGMADYKKCSICFSDSDPITKGSFYITGRYCPNCMTPFHIHCLAGWADSQDEPKLKRSGTVRCPHCFYLLKIPSEVSQAQKLKVLSGTSTNIDIESGDRKKVRAIQKKASELGDEAMYNSCPVCNMIFEEDQDVVKCGNSDCGTLYHKDCFEKLYNKICKNCGSKLVLN
ncbi:MAG: VWA domain-containing protein [Candidatus Lokiarchaeota archaeon]|nr:VWA domain-containing protein [Candidatus Lokiarchaeota archaeon]